MSLKRLHQHLEVDRDTLFKFIYLMKPGVLLFVVLFT